MIGPFVCTDNNRCQLTVILRDSTDSALIFLGGPLGAVEEIKGSILQIIFFPMQMLCGLQLSHTINSDLNSGCEYYHCVDKIAENLKIHGFLSCASSPDCSSVQTVLSRASESPISRFFIAFPFQTALDPSCPA